VPSDAAKGGKFGVALQIALVAPAVIVAASWSLQSVAKFPPRTPGAAMTAAAFLLGSIAALAPAAIAFGRIAREPSARILPNYLLAAISLVALLPAALILWASLVGV